MLSFDRKKGYEDIKKLTWKLMLNNRRKSGKYQYTVPSPQTYPYQWLWDSCFHAIILSHLSIEDAKKELLSLVSKQFDNGLIPHMIYWKKFTKTDFPVIEWGKGDTSTITQPPMIATSAWKIYQADRDKNFLKRIYDSLKKFYNYLALKRDPRKIYLIGIINPDESGEDNSPRFDELLGLPPVHSLDVNFQKRLELVAKHRYCNFETETCMKDFLWVKDVPFNVLKVKGLDDLSKIAREIGFFEDADYFTRQSALIRNAMRELMLEDGIFWSVFGEDYKKIKVKTWAIFFPMFANLYTFDQAKRLIGDYLLNDKYFQRRFLVPSVSKDEPSYDPSGPWRGIAKLLSTHVSWRGPIWMATNWFVYKGLINYGFFEIAQQIFDTSLKLVQKSGFREQYNPETGEGFGALDFTWAGLILDMEKNKD